MKRAQKEINLIVLCFRPDTIYHILLSLGLELGKHHSVHVGLTYDYQPSVKQIIGAFTLGLNIPLKGN